MSWRAIHNFLAFQAAWFAAVWGAAHDREELGLAAIVAVVAIHLWIARSRRGEAWFVLASLPLGFVVNEVLHRSGAVVGRGTILPPSLAPLWLLGLWPLFATVFNESMRWMRGRPLVAAAFGVVGAPLSYLGGARLGAVALADRPLAWIVPVSVTWAGAMLVLGALQTRWTSVTPTTPTTRA